jgi:hypothetical protein
MAAPHGVGDSFLLQFVWQLPDGDYIRALCRAEVLAIIEPAEKYMVRLTELVAGSQESRMGEGRDKDEFSKTYWAMVVRLIGKQITVAWETADGRPLPMRLATLTGEHDFFTRFEVRNEK